MTEDGDPAVTTEAEFHRELRALVRAACSNGVTVGGGWAVPGEPPDESNWDVEIVAIDREE